MTRAQLMRTSYVMKLLSMLALVGLLAACAVPPPDPNVHAATVHEVQPAAFHSAHSMYFQSVDDGSTYMQQLAEHVPVEHPDHGVRGLQSSAPYAAPRALSSTSS